MAFGAPSAGKRYGDRRYRQGVGVGGRRGSRGIGERRWQALAGVGRVGKAVAVVSEGERGGKDVAVG